MVNPPPNQAPLEARVTALESRIEQVAEDAAAARHLAAARDRDLADFALKIDANRRAINGLGVQTAAHFKQVDRRFDLMDRRFDLMDRKFEAVDDKFGEVDRRFDAMDRRFEAVDDRLTQIDDSLADIRGTLGVTAAGQQHIVDMLTVLIDRQDETE